jgi:hypothetical protein
VKQPDTTTPAEPVLANAEVRVREARSELGAALLKILRSGEEIVRFDDPRVAPLLAIVKMAEQALAEVDLYRAKKAKTAES